MGLGRLSILSVILLLSASVLIPDRSSHASTSSATITTDQSDYLLGSVVTIYGSSFSSNVPVIVSVTDPNALITTWSVMSDLSGELTTTFVLDLVSGDYLVTATDGANSASTTFHSANEAANLDQCTNGGVGAPIEPCDIGVVGGTSYSNWVNGNSNGQKSHWNEGNFIAYRVTITGLTAGTHTMQFSWDTVHSREHALDYIGSLNATETFAATPTRFHFNNNDPCQDKISTCVPASPDSSVAVPLANMATAVTCDSASGAFSGSQIPGKIFAWGTGTILTGFSYASENSPSGTGQCTTTGELTFATVIGTSTVVVAWGGHIASQTDWGVGNSASSISGSPYHTVLVSLDGESTGAQNRALATTAMFFTPTISTRVIDDSTGLAIVSPLALGTSVHDTATLSGASATPTGNVVYNFYANGACSESPSTIQTVALSGGLIPRSASTGPLGAGYYSYNATYNGDSVNFPTLPNSACEPFTVSKANTTINIVLTEIAGNDTWTVPPSSALTLGALFNVSATVGTQVDGFSITGTVTYTLYSGCSYSPAWCVTGPVPPCTGTLVQTSTLPVGATPPTFGGKSLYSGPYCMIATYGGDSNYFGSSTSQSFVVGAGASGGGGGGGRIAFCD